jgi:hypothetical protein
MAATADKPKDTFIQDAIDNMWHLQEAEASSHQSFAARMVWLVAISGLILFEVPNLADKLKPLPLSDCDILFLSMPWALVALLCLMSNLVVSILDHLALEFYREKHKLLDALRADWHDKKDMEAYIDIRDSNTTRLGEMKRKCDTPRRAANVLSIMALVLFIISLGTTAWKLFTIAN